jgi:hypothetical protein
MDNLARNARSCGEDDRPALKIGQAGWEQVPWVRAAKEWPADDEVLTITLRRERRDQLAPMTTGTTAHLGRGQTPCHAVGGMVRV